VKFTPQPHGAVRNKATTMNRLAGMLKAFAADDVGSSAVEYAVIAVVITTSFVSVVANFSPILNGILDFIGQRMTDSTAAAN
jgi:Flp pilus assembly pilin Flp